MVGHDPIRGDIPQHEIYMLGVGVEEDARGVPDRPGGRNSVGRHSVRRQRSTVSRGEGTVVGHRSGRGSTVMTDPDAIPVCIPFFLSVDKIGGFSRASCRQRRRFNRGCNPLSMLQQRKETSTGNVVRFSDLYWALYSHWQ